MPLALISSLGAAYAVHDLMIMALALEVEEICTTWGIGRFAFAEEPGIFDFDVFDKANWERLAELAGEPVDMTTWQAWARERAKLLADGRSVSRKNVLAVVCLSSNRAPVVAIQ